MKFITLFLSLLASTFLLSTSALAHTDHMLGDGSLHTLYHGIFWGLFAAVVYKIYLYCKAKKTNKSQ
jgi:hypothetical protein